jgi:hypothetical protein
MTKINLFLSVAMTALLIGGASRAEVTLASNSTLVGDPLQQAKEEFHDLAR